MAAPSMRDLVVAGGADPARVRVVLNWTDERIFHPAEPTRAARRLVRRRRPLRGDVRRHHRRPAGPGDGGPGRRRAATGTMDLVLVGSGRGRAAGAGARRRAGRRQRPLPRAAVAAGDARPVRRRRLPAGHAARPCRSCAAPCPGSSRRRLAPPRRWWPPPGGHRGDGGAGPGRAVLPARGLGRPGRPVLAGRHHPAAGPAGDGATRPGDVPARDVDARPAWTGSRSCCTRRPRRAAVRTRRKKTPVQDSMPKSAILPRGLRHAC